jgi:hypothetical protein
VHKIVDAPLVAGYTGGSIIDVWEKLLPLVEADRVNRAAAGRTDHKYWLEYFQYLYDTAIAAEAGRKKKDGRMRAAMRRIRHG